MRATLRALFTVIQARSPRSFSMTGHSSSGMRAAGRVDGVMVCEQHRAGRLSAGVVAASGLHLSARCSGKQPAEATLQGVSACWP